MIRERLRHAPGAEVAADIVRRGLVLLPIGLLVGGLVDGAAGAISIVYAIAIVLCNFAIAAAMLAWASNISFAAVAGAALSGYFIRLTFVFAAVWFVRNTWWFSPVVLGLTIIVTHLGLLLWELRYVAGSMAYPGLKPTDSRSAVAGRS